MSIESAKYTIKDILSHVISAPHWWYEALWQAPAFILQLVPCKNYTCTSYSTFLPYTLVEMQDGKGIKLDRRQLQLQPAWLVSVLIDEVYRNGQRSPDGYGGGTLSLSAACETRVHACRRYSFAASGGGAAIWAEQRAARQGRSTRPVCALTISGGTRRASPGTKRAFADVQITFLTRVWAWISRHNVSIYYSSQKYGKLHILWRLSGHCHNINSGELIAWQKTFFHHGLQMNRGNYLFFWETFQKHLHIRDPVWLQLRVALKTNKYENQVTQSDCAPTHAHTTSLFNWQAINITDQPGNNRL